MTTPLTLSDSRSAVEFDPATGGVARFSRTDAAPLVATGRPALFVIEVPRHGDRTVVVRTEDQRLGDARPDGDGIRLEWTDPVSDKGERLTGHIVVTALLRNGRLVLDLDAHLRGARIEALRFPVLRGVRAETGDALEWRGVDYSTGTRVSLAPRFDNNSPYWGTVHPDYASGNLRPEVVCNPTSPLVQLHGTGSGLAVLPDEPTLEFIGWRASLEPGYADSLIKTPDPEAEVVFEAIHLPPAGDAVRATRMAVEPYAGEWTRGLEPYRRTQGESRQSDAAWLDEPRSWLQVQLMSTENEPRYDFDRLTRIIEECAELGIGAIQIVGWNEGGQDGLVPVHRPAERLGGEDGLRRALARARELDVKTVLYVKYQWVEKPGPSWDELAPYVCLDENGQSYAQPGPVYHSSRKRYGVSTPWYVPLCFAVDELRARFADEVRDMATWGADGILADESLYHGRALLCFAEDHGHAPGASTYLWDGAFVEDLRAAAAEVSGGFVIAGEGCYDAQFEHYDVSYFRSASAGHIPTGRLLRPRSRIVTALVGFDDRDMVNQALLHGYGMSLEPFHFKGVPSDMPRTVSYATRADALRARLSPWLWNGVLELEHDVTARAEGGDAHPQLAVWTAPDLAGRVVVVANFADEARRIELAGVAADAPVELVGGTSGPSPLDGGTVHLPPRSAAVVLDGVASA